MISFAELREHAITKSGVHHDAVIAFLDRAEEAQKVELTPVEVVPDFSANVEFTPVSV